tara:strand:- start:455 stop:1024 length:570 start_codon:yes stop_codon:yes gene_type:complete
MACTSLTKGRGLDCNRVSGGIKYVYFGVTDQIAAITVVGSSVTDIAMSGSNKLYRYSVPRGSTSVSDSVTGSTNGSISYAPTLSMVMNRLTKEDQNEIKLLGQTQVTIFVQLNATKTTGGQDIIMALGVKNSLSLNSGSASSGAAFSDRNGYTLGFEGFEPAPSPILIDYTTDPFDNIDSGGPIVIIAS